MALPRMGVALPSMDMALLPQVSQRCALYEVCGKSVVQRCDLHALWEKRVVHRCAADPLQEAREDGEQRPCTHLH